MITDIRDWRNRQRIRPDPVAVHDKICVRFKYSDIRISILSKEGFYAFIRVLFGSEDNAVLSKVYGFLASCISIVSKIAMNPPCRLIASSIASKKRSRMLSSIVI